jgi:hypothetical protein
VSVEQNEGAVTKTSGFAHGGNSRCVIDNMAFAFQNVIGYGNSIG